MIRKKNSTSTERSPNWVGGDWLCFGVTAISATVSLVYSLLGLTGVVLDEVASRYAASRSVASALGVVVVLLLRSRPALVVVAVVMAVVQGLDALVGLAAGDVLKTVGPAATAVATVLVTVPVARRLRQVPT